MGEVTNMKVSQLDFDPRLVAVTPIPELIAGIRKGAKGASRAQKLAKADALLADWKGFVQSISQNGVRDAIKVRTQGKNILVMDGRHRLLAAQEAGLSEIPCVWPDVDYSRENADEDDRSIILDSENRRHLSKGAIAYRAVILYPEVALNAKKGKQMDNDYPFKSQAELADRVGVSHPMMKAACALYRVFYDDDHKVLKIRHESSVWTCESIVKLLGEVNASMKRFEATGSYDLPKKSREDKKAEDLKTARLITFNRIKNAKIIAEEISDGWDLLKTEELEAADDYISEIVDIYPTAYLEQFVKAAKTKLEGSKND